MTIDERHVPNYADYPALMAEYRRVFAGFHKPRATMLDSSNMVTPERVLACKLPDGCCAELAWGTPMVPLNAKYPIGVTVYRPYEGIVTNRSRLCWTWEEARAHLDADCPPEPE